MLTVFWDAEVVVFCVYLEEQLTINSQYYSDILLNKVKPAMREKRRGSQRRSVILHQDNARPHTAQLTREIINKMGWEVLPHPPYSPDLAPCDFHLFGSLKEHYVGRSSRITKMSTNLWEIGSNTKTNSSLPLV